VSVTAARGFRASGVTAGLKPSGRPDMALLVNDGPRSAAAAVFTTNRCQAYPVAWSRQVVGGGVVKAVIVNSGGANCFTGPDGVANVHATAERVAGLLGVGASEVAVCSTGLIGLLNPQDRLLEGCRRAYDSLSLTGGRDAVQAIRTTDKVTKEAALASSAGYTVGGMAKGAGMLAPALATMLVYVTTDADVDAATADRALRAATRVTFDRLDSDGCMSTNDTVLLMASGASGVVPDEAEFAATIRSVCHDLMLQLLHDAEGAEHDIAISVVGAVDETDAVDVGRAVARSSLFKCAIFGRDPNWGRILASVGTTSAAFDPEDIDVALNGVWVCRKSAPAEPADLVDLTPRDVAVTIDLKTGNAEATVWTNDLTSAYVHENSAYST
jgi:glutamate N-acetyltransferase/amino-acid N-acetyltransferase